MRRGGIVTRFGPWGGAWGLPERGGTEIGKANVSVWFLQLRVMIEQPGAGWRAAMGISPEEESWAVGPATAQIQPLLTASAPTWNRVSTPSRADAPGHGPQAGGELLGDRFVLATVRACSVSLLLPFGWSSVATTDLVSNVTGYGIEPASAR